MLPEGDLRDYVLRLRCPIGDGSQNVRNGSGFLVERGARTWLVTALHVLTGEIENTRQGTIRSIEPQTLGAVGYDCAIPVGGFEIGGRDRSRFVIFESLENAGSLMDLIAIKLNKREARRFQEVPAFSIPWLRRFDCNREVEMAGWPLVSERSGGGFEFATIQSEIECYRMEEFVTTARPTGGMSGGPVIQNGGLVGVVSANTETSGICVSVFEQISGLA